MKPILLFIISLLFLTSLTELVRAPTVTLTAGVIIQNQYGKLTLQNTQVYNSITVYANGTVYFDIRGLELSQQFYSYTAQSYGNGTFHLKFQGTQPFSITAPGAASQGYIGNSIQVIDYTTSQTSVLVVAFIASFESAQVLFKDEFLTQNPYPSSLWTTDLYRASGSPTGVYTSSGYLVMSQPSTTNQRATLHVSNPSWTNGTSTSSFLKRKLTVSAIPFKQTVTNATADLRVGFSELSPAGAYPGINPAGQIPAPDIPCNLPHDNFFAVYPHAIELLRIDNAGTVTAVTCGVVAPALALNLNNTQVLETGLDATRYSVFTVEYAGVPSTAGTQWVYLRFYQEDSNSKIIASTDKNVNFTINYNINPFSLTNYVFVQQRDNQNTANIVSQIDLVQLQNYGSPVDLKVPPAIPFPTCASSGTNSVCGAGLIPLLVLIAQGFGFGNAQFGAIILFMVWMGAVVTPLTIWTRHTFVTGIGGMLSISLFAYAGLIPTWVIVLEIFATVLLAVLLFRFFLAGTGEGGGGDSSEGGLTGGVE